MDAVATTGAVAGDARAEMDGRGKGRRVCGMCAPVAAYAKHSGQEQRHCVPCSCGWGEENDSARRAPEYAVAVPPFTRTDEAEQEREGTED